MGYYIAKTINVSFEEAIIRVTEELKKEGFGIITEIDMREKLKEKLGVDFRRYTILGACNPPFAYEALQKEDKIGTMLPCNVIVQEISENKIEVAAINPVASMQAVPNPALESMGNKVLEKLQRVIDAL